MHIPVRIAFRSMRGSRSLETKIRKEAEKLERHHDRIISCRVVVEAPHRRSRKGGLYLVTIDVTVPGAELVVNSEKRHHQSHEDIHVALRDAFKAMQRRLEDYSREKAGQVKTHEASPQAPVARMFKDHGFIGTADRGDIYFHRNSVVGGHFDELQEGDLVRFSAVEGEKGLQATTVHPLAKPK